MSFWLEVLFVLVVFTFQIIAFFYIGIQISDNDLMPKCRVSNHPSQGQVCLMSIIPPELVADVQTQKWVPLILYIFIVTILQLRAFLHIIVSILNYLKDFLGYSLHKFLVRFFIYICLVLKVSVHVYTAFAIISYYNSEIFQRRGKVFVGYINNSTYAQSIHCENGIAINDEVMCEIDYFRKWPDILVPIATYLFPFIAHMTFSYFRQLLWLQGLL